VTLRIATAASFRYDRVAAHLRLVQSVEVDILLLSYLDGEVLSRLAIERESDGGAGYVPEIVAAVGAVAPRLFLEPELRVLTDAGGLNPSASAQAIARVLADAGSGELPLAVVRGDDLRESLEELAVGGCRFEHRQTGEAFTDLQRPILAAHARLGAAGVRQALDGGARMVVTGVTTTSSFAVAAAASAFRWVGEEWDNLAGSALAGTLLARGALLSCGETGDDVSELVDVAPPIAEVWPNGQVALSKIPGAGGRLTPHAIAESIADTACDRGRFRTPDVDLNLTNAELAERPERRDILLQGVTGHSPAASYDATLWHHDGYASMANLWIGGRAGSWSVERVAELVGERVRRSGQSLESLVACGIVPAHGGIGERAAAGLVELKAMSKSRAAVEQFADEVAALPRSIPCQVILLGGPRPSVEPLVRRWPTLVPREVVHPVVDVRPAREWL
jgi:hypothetical protein